VLTILLNDLGAIAADIVLVLDDYHVIDVQHGMSFLLEHLPPRLHVVIVSRADPALPLARLRARGELAEIRAAELRFTPDDAAAYFNETMGLRLTAPDAAALEGRTEGWIAALQLAALSLQGRDDVAGFIAGFAGNDRYVVDYLVEEEYRRLPAGIELYRAALAAAAGLLGLTSWGPGDLEAAHGAWSACVAGLRRAGFVADIMGCSLALADIRSTQGRLGEAMRTYEQALGLAREEHASVLRGMADMHAGMSEVYRERDDLAAAARHLLTCQELGEHNGLPQHPYREHRADAHQEHLRQARGDQPRGSGAPGRGTRPAAAGRRPPPALTGPSGRPPAEPPHQPPRVVMPAHHVRRFTTRRPTWPSPHKSRQRKRRRESR
jgi:hypothetical protein